MTDNELDEQTPVKIPVKLRVSIRLAGASFDGTRRSYAIDHEGDGLPPDDAEMIGHQYDTDDFSIEVPQKLMAMLTADCFLEIVVLGKKDYITDDATEDVKTVTFEG